MLFKLPLVEGKLLKRYDRFFADVRIPSKKKPVQAYVASTGSLKGCSDPGSRVWVSENLDPQHKLRYTLEIVDTGDSLVGVHTGHTNHLVAEALEDGEIPELDGYAHMHREVWFDNNRFDFMLEGGETESPRCFVEVKAVTLAEDGVAMYPDAITERGRRQLETLARAVSSGHRAVVLFVVQRTDGGGFRPADSIDPRFGKKLRDVHARGVDILVYRAWISPEELRISRRLPLEL